MSTSPTKSPEWRPLAAQRAALACGAYELLYGGAAGGGKSDYLLVAPLRWVHLPASRAILFRRSFPELERTLIARSHTLYRPLGASYHATRREWAFPFARSPDHEANRACKADGRELFTA